ncbi:Protein of unknown function [Pyronema omphalodes CBS 100304]|uniref:Uncharacterized protein n=1 Tax=Pyronema omphalodes (strain CBS 100304) TaxID=1076935 RepID=U4LEQ3_PYROM|nr:Protein of unknown function [Pyronema omphalodes CBS 100304]
MKHGETEREVTICGRRAGVLSQARSSRLVGSNLSFVLLQGFVGVHGGDGFVEVT